MNIQQIPQIIASELAIRPQQVTAVMNLLDDGNTIPFIARYRKEATGELDEEQIRSTSERLQYLRNFCQRQAEIIAAITAQDKMTAELQKAIDNCQKLQELEDLYLPYRPKKRTRAQIARERGLEPLALLISQQEIANQQSLADLLQKFINADKDLPTVESVLAGVSDIIAENIADTATIRAALRQRLQTAASINAKLAVSPEEGKEFLNYAEYDEPISRIPSHRILAINRGERLNKLKLTLNIDHNSAIALVEKIVIHHPSVVSSILSNCCNDSYKRLLLPSLERELRSELTAQAEEQAIKVFAQNLRPLLLQPPLSGLVVIGLDPGYRTGCKLAVVDQTGKVLHTDVIYLTMSDSARQAAADKLTTLCRKFNVNLISIGNGTASYETEQFVAELINQQNLSCQYIIVNEAGASVYSASPLARAELPDLDVALRGAVSIARRIQDPLAELVKIDPKSIGVGQYQHDVNQKQLSQALGGVVESAVNSVGVDINTASAELLSYVAGINGTLARNIVTFREQIGSFRNRRQLQKISRLGPAAFTQCAGFLKVANGDNPLDNTNIHPESYPLTEKILHALGADNEIFQDKAVLKTWQAKLPLADCTKLADKLDAGEPTVRDILASLARPGRDPREDLPPPVPRKNITQLSDLQTGSIVRGTVHNVTDFGAFIDIGVKINGLAHKSELSQKYFRHPLDVVKVGDVVDCMILNIDEQRQRIALSLKAVTPKSTK